MMHKIFPQNLEEPYLDNLDKKWWSDYLTRPRDDEGYDKASEEVIKKLDKLRKMPFYDQEAVENSMKFLGLNLNPKLFTHLNPDGTPWTPEKKRFFEGLDAKGYPGENTKPSHPSAPYFEPPDQLKKFLYELRTSESYDRKVAEQIIREERGLNIHPKWFTKLKPDGTPEYPEEDAFYRRMEKEEELV